MDRPVVSRPAKSPVTVDIQRQAIVDFCRSIARNLNAPGPAGRVGGERKGVDAIKLQPSVIESAGASGVMKASRVAKSERVPASCDGSSMNDSSMNDSSMNDSSMNGVSDGVGVLESAGSLGVKWVDPSGKPLGPRVSQIMDRLLAGDGEKQVAAALGISQHTVHDHVKRLYKRFGVCSRSELLARFVRTDRSGTESR